MTEPTLCAELRARDIHVWADGDQLQCDAPAGALTRDLREQLQRHKSEILEFLRGPAELSFAQQRLWFLDQVEQGGTAYVIARALEIRGSLDVPVLERSLAALVTRHDSLRTVFINAEGRPLQVISQPGEWRLPVEDLTEEADPRQRLAHQLQEASSRSFDLARGPLFRAQLFRVASDVHVLLLTMHHIISDGWSIDIMLRELGVLSRQLSLRQSTDLPTLRLQYRDFARWQRTWLRSEAVEAQVSHWKSRLGGAPQVLELPTDHPRPPVESHRGAIYSFTLAPELMDSLRGLARRERATLFGTMVSGFTLLLARYTGQEDLLVGTPVANRDRAEFEGIVGLFVNTVVLRAELSGNPSVRQYLARMRDVCLDAVAHQDVPFDRLVEELQPRRDLSRNPLFQVMFAHQSVRQDGLELQGLRVSPLLVHAGGALFDLALQVEETAEGLHAFFNYATDLFEESTIARMASHWRALLEAMVASPDRSVWELPLLTEAERQQLLIEWNDTGAVYRGQNLCLHELIETQVRRTPEQVALVFEDRQLTYAELDRRANQLAHCLQALGVGADTLVGLFVERSLEMVVGLLGILKAGGAYVPIDPEYPAERVAFMLQDAGIKILLTQEHTKRILPEHSLQTICLDSDWNAIAKHDATTPHNRISSDNLAYMIYTSGSTGKPKGALNTHRGICNRLLWMQDRYQLTPADTVLQKTPCSFDVSVWEFFWPLLAGARLVMARPAGHRDPAYLARLIRDERVTVLHFVPSMLGAFLTEPTAATCTTLRHVICSGEALPHDLQKKFFAQLSCDLHNLYGPTEAAVDVTHWTCERHSKSPLVPIGRPVANTQIYILDRALQPVPIGVAGELYIGGVQVGRGYHNRPELTAQKFVRDPFSSDPTACLYRTGDLARWLPNGNIDYLGRLDSQVKVRGFRIELGEIEHVLVTHGGVKEAVVVTSDEQDADKRLVAYYVAPSHKPVEPSELGKVLRDRLPDYMVPSCFVEMATLPLSPNGKLDRKALPAPSYENLQPAREFVRPHTETESALAAIWTEVLKVERIGLNDNFFDLGGHSLLAIKTLSRIRDVFEIDLAIRTFFSNPTLGELATVLTAAKDSCELVQRIAPRAQTGPSPLSFAQERFWLLYELAPTSPVYNIIDVVHFAGTYDADAMRKALTELVRRHETLRTVISQHHGQLTQIVVPATDATFSELDLGTLPEPEREREWTRTVREQLAKPFDLSQSPPFRAMLVHMMPEEHKLLLTLHHIIADEWSMDVLRQEITQLYAAFCEGRPSPLPELSIQYADFACWQRDWFQGDVRQRQIDYWKNNLAGAPSLLELPTDKPRPAVQSWRGAAQIFNLPKDLMERLKALARQHQATLFMTLEAAFAALLYRYTGQEDFLVGTPMSGRPQSETQRVIGCFVNTVVLRAQLTDDMTFRSLLNQVRERALGAYAHADLPFDHLVAELAPERDSSRTPLVQVMFLYETGGISPAVKILAQELETGTAKVELAVSMSETGDGLEGIIEYSTDLFQAQTVRRLVEHYRILLEVISREPEQRISMLPLLSAAEREQMLVKWNDNAAVYPGQNLCLHQLIEEQCDRTPDELAVVFEQETLTYAKLDARANQVAHHLKALGVEPDMLVGLFVERSLEMVVALLGILKSGAAYVPIDTAFPPERIAFILADANVTALLTQNSLLAGLPKGTPAVCLDTVQWIDGQGRAHTQVNADNLAYVIYTSGSTGHPKGVCIEHRSIVNYVLGVAQRLQLTPGMQHATVSTIAADLGNTVIFPALITGGCLHIVSQERAESQARLSDYFAREHIDVLKIVPSHLAALQSGKNPERVMPRRRLILGGEASRLDWIERLRALSPSCEIYNHYGPTETTVGVLTYRVGPQLPSTRTSTLPLGRPLPNSRIFILDQHRQAVPVGVQGELCIGGAGVARGYLNRPELTAEKFISDPFHPGGRLYRTGDRARYLVDGNIEFCGRIDHQVKMRGYRIELGEIEAALREQPGLRDAVVLASEDDAGNKQLVAYVVPKRAHQPLWESSALHVLPDGSTVAHLNRHETDYIYNEIFVLQAYVRHGITIRDGDVIVDAGANIGLFTVFANRLAENLRVLAFEPNPAAFACLKANADAYGKGVTCFPIGLSRDERSASLTFFEGFSLLSGFYADAATEREVVKTYALNQVSESSASAQVAEAVDQLLEDRFRARSEAAQLRSLSSVIADAGVERIDLLKINVEKSELDVLLGIRPADWARIRQLVIEVDQRDHLEPISMLLEQQGYEVLVEQDPLLRKTELCYVYAIRPSAAGRLVRQQPAHAPLHSLRPVDQDIVTPTILRAHLEKRLPQYMIPSAFVLMEKFPLTANGKLDRKALPPPSYQNQQTAREFVRPQTQTEQALAAIWTEVLNIKRIGLEDNFFNLGGHSLLAIKTLSRIRDVFEVDLPTRTLFEKPVLADWAEAIDALQWLRGPKQPINNTEHREEVLL